MVITAGRVALAVVALAVFLFLQRRGQRRAEEHMKRLKELQRQEPKEEFRD